ncbi:MAG: gluconate 2-dehydrogenase subunit 3 family protein [Chitinophagaceae bacterium]|nr:gluconate 2-dehydrogenase subunit 3 family protein [Chitinophagaceae bacterium]
MDRRELLKMVALLTGGVVVGGEVFLTGCTAPGTADVGFTPANISLLDEIGETILPATSSPGAKAAQVGDFMRVMVTDCYNQKQQEAFNNGLTQIDEESKKLNNKTFMESTPEQRKALLINLEKVARQQDKDQDTKEEEKKEQAEREKKEYEAPPKHYFTMMKQLTLMGFFTSKPGATQALRHIPVPGKYDGDYPYKKGDKAWAE